MFLEGQVIHNFTHEKKTPGPVWIYRHMNPNYRAESVDFSYYDLYREDLFVGIFPSLNAADKFVQVTHFYIWEQ